MMIKRLAIFRGRELGILLSGGIWRGFIGSPALPLPGRHLTSKDAIEEVGIEIARFDEIEENSDTTRPAGYRRLPRPRKQFTA